MTSVPSKESNRLSIEEALSTLTHQCRSKPGLKLRPESCQIRKAQKQKIADGKSYDIFWECRDCPGPVARNGGEMQTQPTSAAPKSGKKRGITATKTKRKAVVPGPCRVCGRRVGETKFYPSQMTRCIDCMKAAKRVSGAPAGIPMKEESETMAEQAQEEVLLELPESPRQEEAVPMPYECPTHGRHAGRMFGRSHSKLCPACHTEKMKVRMKAVHKTRTNGVDSGSMTIPGWVADWCVEKAAAHGVSPRDYLIGQIAREVPSDWLKDWLIKKG